MVASARDMINCTLLHSEIIKEILRKFRYIWFNNDINYTCINNKYLGVFREPAYPFHVQTRQISHNYNNVLIAVYQASRNCRRCLVARLSAVRLAY